MGNDDIDPVSADVLLLLFNGFVYFLRSTFFAFGQIQILFSGLFTIYTEHIVIIIIADHVNYFFRVLPSLFSRLTFWRQLIFGEAHVASRIIDTLFSVLANTSSVTSVLLPSTESSGLLQFMIITLISLIISSSRHFLNSVSNDGICEDSLWNSPEWLPLLTHLFFGFILNSNGWIQSARPNLQ